LASIKASLLAQALFNHAERDPRMKDIPLSLYIHVPWCEKKCPARIFTRIWREKPRLMKPWYVRELLKDLDNDIEKYAEIITARNSTVFIMAERPLSAPKKAINYYLMV
jgi:coproporphyrinogen III oxidase-like Fe-S oxidoreductase